MLAIATQNPDSIPETYVRQHIRLIAPDNVVVLYFEGTGLSLGKGPSLRVARYSEVPKVLRKIRSGWNVIATGYSGAVVGREQKRVSSFLSDNGVKTVFAEFGPTGCALQALCIKRGIKLIVNFHGYDATVMPQRPLIRRAYRLLAKNADGFVCGSIHFAGLLEKLGFPSSKIHVIPCGIEVDEFSENANKDPGLVLAVGRLTEKKAPHLSIEAFSLVQKRFPNSRLEIIGDGPLRQLCEQRITELGLEQKVILHGSRNHEFVKERLSLASIFIQHSVIAANGDIESQGISLLEAMASGVPVVTTNHNGFSETVIQAETGFLVEEKDVVAMGEKIIRLLGDPPLGLKMGQMGRKRVVEHYSADSMALKLREVLSLV